MTELDRYSKFASLSHRKEFANKGGHELFETRNVDEALGRF
jgi:hypothetical protein